MGAPSGPSGSGLLSALEAMDHLNDCARYRSCMLFLAQKGKMIRPGDDQEPTVGRDREPVSLMLLVPFCALGGEIQVLVDPAIGGNDRHGHGAHTAEKTDLA